MIGRVLARYKLLEKVGQGGMAVVYRGVDTTLGREVAVKVLHPHLASLDESKARLEREAQAVAKLHHDNILEIYDYASQDSAERFIVTEFIHGTTLIEFIREQTLEFPEVAAMILSEVTGALQHAHRLGVIHRDVKPENVMIRNDGLLKLTDFGIAQIVDKERLTVTGQLLGSPAYMAPENVEGGPIDARTDVFASGILLYQLATGKLPFRGRNPHEVLKRIAECRYTPPEQVNPLVSPKLSQIIARALSRIPNDRYPEIGQMQSDLLLDLADVGISDPRAELRDYFEHRHTWASRFRRRMVETLGEKGRALAAKGRTAAAIALWNRALTVTPHDAAIRRMIDGLAGRQRRGRTIWAGVAMLAVVGGALAVARWVQHRPLVRAAQPDLAVAVVVAPRPPPLVADAGVLPTKIAHRPPVETPRPDTKRVGLPTVSRANWRYVTIHTVPKAVEIFVDGASVGSYDGRPIKVAQGPHDLLFRNPCCADASVRLEAEESAHKPVRLQWKTARIQLVTRPEVADVFYTTARRRTETWVRSTQPIIIAIPPESETGEMDVHLRVAASGYREERLDVKARAGQPLQRELDLVRLP